MGDFSDIADRVSPVTLELLQITSAIGHGLLDYLTEDLTLEEASVLLGRLYGAVLFEVAVSAATAGWLGSDCLKSGFQPGSIR